MDLVKLLLIAAAAVLAFSCSQTATTPTSNTSVLSNTNSAGVVAAITPQPRNAPAGNIDRKQRMLSAESAQLVDVDADDYATNCMICHKDTGKGGKTTIKGKSLNAADLTSEKMKKRTDGQLFKDISEGVQDEGMPAFHDKLSEDQITSVVAHVRKLQAQK